MVSKANIEESVPDFVAVRDKLWNIRFVRTLRWAGVNVPANVGTITSAHASRSGMSHHRTARQIDIRRPVRRILATTHCRSQFERTRRATRGRARRWTRTARSRGSLRPTARGMAPALSYLDGLFAFDDPSDFSKIARQLRRQGLHDRIGYEHNARREKS